MNPTERLMNEHRVIETVLACLTRVAEEARGAGRLDPAPARDAIAFLREYADRLHHGKEEAELFPFMEARGYSRSGGPVFVMIREHEQGRDFIRSLEAAVEAAAGGDAAAIRTFDDQARAYARMLRDHIHKEDHCLFPMAQQAMRDGDERALTERFEKVETEERALGTHVRSVATARALCARYGVPVDAIDAYEAANAAALAS